MVEITVPGERLEKVVFPNLLFGPYGGAWPELLS